MTAFKQVDALESPWQIRIDPNSIILQEKGENTSTKITRKQKENNWTTISSDEEECTLPTISQAHGEIVNSLTTIFKEEDEENNWTTISLSSSPLVSPLGSRKGKTCNFFVFIAIENINLYWSNPSYLGDD